MLPSGPAHHFLLRGPACPPGEQAAGPLILRETLGEHLRTGTRWAPRLPVLQSCHCFSVWSSVPSKAAKGDKARSPPHAATHTTCSCRGVAEEQAGRGSCRVCQGWKRSALSARGRGGGAAVRGGRVARGPGSPSREQASEQSLERRRERPAHPGWWALQTRGLISSSHDPMSRCLFSLHFTDGKTEAQKLMNLPK